MLFFFFNDTATTEIYSLSLHDALPIWGRVPGEAAGAAAITYGRVISEREGYRYHGRVVRQECWTVLQYWLFYPFNEDRKSTRLNSSHANISYAVFCLKKKKKH